MHAAFLLAKAGFAVEVFEREQKTGGMVRFFIPGFKFSTAGIEKQTEKLLQLGVKIHFGKAIGKHLSLQQLAAYNDAVVLATGAWKEKRLAIAGEQLPGVSYWTVFLRSYNEGRIKELNGKKAIVIGAGDTAIDCARTAARLGAAALIVYRKGRQRMPAAAMEVEAAEKDGVQFLFHLSPVKFKGEKKLQAIVFGKTIEQEGKMQLTGQIKEIKADLAIIAIGQEPDLSVLQGSGWQSLAELPEKIVAAGDLVNEKKLIATAIRSAAGAVEKIKKIAGN